ncbi:MAG: hypothetical protein RBS34_16650, partial [Desulfofustis sp.]|nr:hypothetical protein [Desulfofustis sp.]
IRLQYDIYHMQRMEGDLINTIRRLIDRIGHIQLADTPDAMNREPGRFISRICSKRSTRPAIRAGSVVSTSQR